MYVFDDSPHGAATGGWSADSTASRRQPCEDGTHPLGAVPTPALGEESDEAKPDAA
jgi:hypothetical protein